MRKSIFAALVVVVFSNFASAQDLGSALAKVAKPYAQAYIAPAVNAFGMDMNSGLFHNASVGGALPFGLSLYVGVQMGGALVPSSDKTFNLSYHDTVGIPATYTVTNAPTIFGTKDKASLSITPDNPSLRSTTLPAIGGLVNTAFAPIPIPQVGLGSLFGTDVMVRWLPQIKIANYGKFHLFGWALRHSVSQYIPLIPVDIAVQLGFQNFGIKDSAGGDIFKLSTFAANVEVSKTFAILTVYGGLQMESSKVDVNYTFTPPSTIDPNQTPIPISFSQNGKNKFRALLGLDLGLGPLTINADYSIGAVNAVTAGLGVTI